MGQEGELVFCDVLEKIKKEVEAIFVENSNERNKKCPKNKDYVIAMLCALHRER